MHYAFNNVIIEMQRQKEDAQIDKNCVRSLLCDMHKLNAIIIIPTNIITTVTANQ